jgi:hypothetical protein
LADLVYALLAETARGRVVYDDMLLRQLLDTFRDSDAWDECAAERAPSVHRYAAAVTLWLYYLGEVGGTIAVDCPLFSEVVAAAVPHWLVTGHAAQIRDALRDVREGDVSAVSSPSLPLFSPPFFLSPSLMHGCMVM